MRMIRAFVCVCVWECVVCFWGKIDFGGHTKRVKTNVFGVKCTTPHTSPIHTTQTQPKGRGGTDQPERGGGSFGIAKHTISETLLTFFGLFVLRVKLTCKCAHGCVCVCVDIMWKCVCYVWICVCKMRVVFALWWAPKSAGVGGLRNNENTYNSLISMLSAGSGMSRDGRILALGRD